MLGDKDVHVDLAVSNMSESKKFYEEMLGLKILKEWDNEVYLKSGTSKLKLYLSEYAGTNQATYASWDVDNVSEVVAHLKAKGVSFENYDMPGVTHEGDVHVWGKMKSAWFKDPDGNILCIGNNTIIA
jgi:catechol 2,3-dioxygenase-like lactoylglutathione lyase family enzyme